MSDKLKVRIRARQTVHFDQTVTMTRKEWERIKGTSETALMQNGEVEGWLDTRDVSDCDNIEDDFEMEVVDDAGKSLDPPDYYGMD